jgi:hypothetical protein
VLAVTFALSGLVAIPGCVLVCMLPSRHFDVEVRVGVPAAVGVVVDGVAGGRHAEDGAGEASGVGAQFLLAAVTDAHPEVVRGPEGDPAAVVDGVRGRL